MELLVVLDDLLIVVVFGIKLLSGHVAVPQVEVELQLVGLLELDVVAVDLHF